MAADVGFYKSVCEKVLLIIIQTVTLSRDKNKNWKLVSLTEIFSGLGSIEATFPRHSNTRMVCFLCSRFGGRIRFFSIFLSTGSWSNAQWDGSSSPVQFEFWNEESFDTV